MEIGIEMVLAMLAAYISLDLHIGENSVLTAVPGSRTKAGILPGQLIEENFTKKGGYMQLD